MIMKIEIPILCIMQEIIFNYCCDNICKENSESISYYRSQEFNACPVSKDCNITNEDDLYFSNMDKKIILERLNTYRHQVALGLYGNPPARNMRELVWNKELALLAQCETNKCDANEIVFTAGDRRLSQNKALISSLYLFRGGFVTLQLAVDIWFQKMRTATVDVDFIENPFNPNRTKNKELVHMIWGDSAEVGCGRTSYSDNNENYTYIICNFKKTDDKKHRIYEIGKPCSLCPDVGSKKGECHDLKLGLCKTYYFVPPPDPFEFDTSKAYKISSEVFVLFSYIIALME